MSDLSHPGRRSGGASLDLAVAALAAVAFAFVTYAMPDDIFSGLIAQSGLPDILAAAQPPLGMKARAAVIAGGAILCFGAILLLMRALDRVPARRPRRAKAEAEAPVEAPRLRRADVHPDAPPRRPLLAGRDFGEPAIDIPETEERFADLAVRPLPGFLVAQEMEEPVEAEPEPEPEIEALAVEEPEQPAAEADPIVPEEPAADAIDALVAQLPEVDADPSESVSNLMQRLESGLSRREQIIRPSAAEPEDPVPPMAEPQVGHRLRNAIDGLHKMAARGS